MSSHPVNPQATSGQPSRIAFMDVLRGFSLLGIFMANMFAFSFYYAADPKANSAFLFPGTDQTMRFLHDMFIEGKFYSIFSLLFGWGMAIQYFNETTGHQSRLHYVLRRLAVMLLLGALHLLLWSGDIVFLYALLGFFLLLFRKQPPRRLLYLGIFFFLLPVLLYWLKMECKALRWPAVFLQDTGITLDKSLIGIDSEAAYQKYIDTLTPVSYIKGNISGFFFRYSDLFFQSRFSKVLGLMLIGFAIGKSGWYHRIASQKRLCYTVIGIGVIVAIPMNYWMATLMSEHGSDYYQFKKGGMYQTIAYALGVAPLALTYVAIMMLLFEQKRCRAFLQKLAPAGRMAFSNYMMQTILGCLIFLPFAGGWLKQVGPAAYTVLAIVIFIFQCIMSCTWLRYFHFGPVEWLWRSGTRGKWQPFRKK